ncbi:MAG TPA: ATP-binding protein [Nitrospiraceae bacterium]|nr:ATP-binding protein [Nitrospiraceae bacterium]
MPPALKAIRHLSEALFQYTNVDDMVRQTLHAALEVIGADAGSVLLANAETRQLVFRYVVGETADTLRETGIPWDEGIAGAVFASGKPEVISTVQQDARHYSATDALTGYQSRDMIVVPLKRHGGNPVGVIEILNKNRGPINRHDLDTLVVLSAIAAAAIEQSKAFEALRVKDVQLQQAQKMEAVGRLAVGVAHDFNNLLTVIKGYSELIVMAVEGNASVRTHAEEVLKAADRAAGVTSQLLAFSRKQVFELRTVRLNEVVANVEKLLRRLIGEDIQLITTVGPNLGWIKADPGQLEQVLMNLAVNARDAMPHGGTLTIRIAHSELDETFTRHHLDFQPGMYCTLSVADSGCGMNKDTLSKLFEPFFTTKDPGKGTGLGLSIVHGIVKQSRGHILVSSEPGVGTTFNIYLPCVEAPAEVGSSSDAVSAASSGTETVLVVEDEAQVRTLECGLLEASGYHVLAASHGGEAMQICREYPGTIHLLVTDLILPQLNGRELARQTVPIRPSMKVLYVSGYPDEMLVTAGVARSQVPFLQKPFASDALLLSVRKVLDGAETTPI